MAAGPGEMQASGTRAVARGFPGAGRLIGQVERLLIFVFILLGQYAAIGFLIAAKSVLRYGELKATDPASADTVRKEAEYVLIGTLLSVAWAIGAGLLTLATLAKVG